VADLYKIKPLVWVKVDGLADEYRAETPFGTARLSGRWRGNQWALDLPWITIGLISRPTEEAARRYADISYRQYLVAWVEPVPEVVTALRKMRDRYQTYCGGPDLPHAGQSDRALMEEAATALAQVEKADG